MFLLIIRRSDVSAPIIEEFAFDPGFRVHYQETVHLMKGGLPKFKNLPADGGGSGDLLP